jgi:actin-related protein
MSQKLLQINVDYAVPTEAYLAASLHAAQPIADMPGLLWKVWIHDDKKRHGGGIYLFESREAVDAYLATPLVEAFRNNPVLSNLSIKVFDIGEEASAITRAPLGVAATA